MKGVAFNGRARKDGNKVDDHADARRQHGMAAEEDQRLIFRQISTVRPIVATDDRAAGGGRRIASATDGE